MISLLILAYNNLGYDIADAAAHILGVELQQLNIVSISYDDTPAKLESTLEQIISDMDQDHRIIILTDIYGATHTNIASKYLVPGKIDMVSGLNLPMLLRVMNYRNLPLDELVNKAISGGQEGITTSKDPSQSRRNTK